MNDYGPACITSARRLRCSSFDVTGGNCDHWHCHPGEERVLMDVPGSGCIRHIWFTLGSKDPLHLRNLILRAYWDGQTQPSVLCPIGDFFGQGHAMYSAFETPWLTASAKGGRALNCYWPMPFANGAKITLENQGDCRVYVYFYIDYESVPSLGDDAGLRPGEAGRRADEAGPCSGEAGRFHAHWRRECLTTPDDDLANTSGAGNFLLADIAGKGQYVGTILYVDSPSVFWYGEGDDMFFIDGEPWPPSLHGTGTEDYFNTAWCPREKSIGPHSGLILSGHPHHKGGEQFLFLGKNTLYRFHSADPIRFEKSLRATIEHGHGNEFVGDWAVTSFWYAQNAQPVPPLPSADKRCPLPELAVKIGQTVERPHKQLSYFFQTGAAVFGQRLIRQMQKLWQQGEFDVPAAQQWSAQVTAEAQAVRQRYLRAEGKIATIPQLGERSATGAGKPVPPSADVAKHGVALEIGCIHGSRKPAPRCGELRLGYNRKFLYVWGSLDIEKKQKAGHEYDQIDLMLADEQWEEAFVMLSVLPGKKVLIVKRHHPNGFTPWDEYSPLDEKVPVDISVSAKAWQFKYRLPWKAIGIVPRAGGKLHLNADRWNFDGPAWWASWAITPQHFYPPQIGGMAIFGETAKAGR